MTRCTVTGETPENPDDAPTPTERTKADGQKADHWVLCEEERAKGFVRPVRDSYIHVGAPGPEFELRDLKDDERERFGGEFAKFEPYPEGHHGSATGKYWTQADINAIGKGCQVKTTMPRAIAETYARQPRYYGSTWCCGCRKYLPVGKDGEFVWGDGSRVGT